MLTGSRRRTRESSEAQEDLAGRPVEDGGDTRRMAGNAYGVRYPRTVYGFGPQNPGGGSEEERTARGGIEEFASRQSYLMKAVVAVG